MEPYFNLPEEPIYDILLNSDYQTIKAMCQTSTYMQQLCQNDYFWKLKFKSDFGPFDKIVNNTWHQSYIFMLRAQTYFNKLTEMNYIEYIIEDVDYYNTFNYQLPIDNTLQHPTRITLSYKNGEIFIKYDEYIISSRQRRDLLNTIITRFVNVNQYIIIEHEAIDFIYILLSQHVRPVIKLGPIPFQTIY